MTNPFRYVSFCQLLAAMFATIVLAGFAHAQENSTDAGAELFRDNVVIVLDASGSMNERMHDSPVTRMDAAKEALQAVIGRVPDNTQVGLVVFSASNLRNDWTYDLQSVNKAELSKAIELPRPGGATPLGQYLKVGADRLLKQREAQRGYGTFRLLVVTDGIASDPILVERYLPDVLARGILVDVIGVDMKQNHPLATRVRSYRKANDPESLVKAVTSALSEVSSRGPQDAAGQEEFELVAAFHPELASAALEALTTSGNHPIGEAAPIRHAAHEEQAPVPQPLPPVAGDPAPRGGFGKYVMIFLGFVLALMFLARSATRKRF